MRVLSTGVLAFAFLVLGSSQSSHAQVIDTPHWTIECVKMVSKGRKIPCDDLNASANTFNFYKVTSINTDAKTVSAVLSFKRKAGADRRRELKVVEVTPARNESDLKQEYWFLAEGRTGIRFQGYNRHNIDNGHMGYAPPGEYNGTVKVQDTLSGDIFTINLSVRVTKIEKK